MCFKAFALTGRIADCLYTQGVALGYELLPLQGVLLWAAWPSGCAAMGCLTFRACCLYGLLGLQGVLLIWASWPSGRAAYMGLLPFQGVLLWVAWPSGCAAMGFLAFRACCCGLLDLHGVAAYMGFCPLPLLYPSASDFQFRYAPVTVGSGRDALTSPKLFWSV